MNKSSLFRFGAILERRDLSNLTGRGNLLERWVVTLGLILAPIAGLRADAPATSLTIRYTGTDFEGRQTFQLEWAAISNAAYVVLQLNSLPPGETWVPIDTVVPTDNAGSYQFAVTATDSTGQPKTPPPPPPPPPPFPGHCRGLSAAAEPQLYRALLKSFIILGSGP